MYLLATNEINKGFCAKCSGKTLDSNANTVFRSSGESGTEEEDIDEEMEENSSNDATEFSAKSLLVRQTPVEFACK